MPRKWNSMMYSAVMVTLDSSSAHQYPSGSCSRKKNSQLLWMVVSMGVLFSTVFFFQMEEGR